MIPEIQIDGTRYDAWTELQVRKSLDQFSHGWTATYVDRWAPRREPWAILPGLTADLSLAGETLVTGYVTQSSWRVSEGQYQASIGARSLTGDLVDCAPFADASGQIRNATLENLIRQICLPFGILVQDDSGDTREFKKFDIELGESAFDAIDRACKSRGVLPQTTGLGEIRLLKADQFSRSVELPADYAHARAMDYTEESRHSDYYVLGQHPGDENFKAAAVVDQSGLAQDGQIERWRPLVIMTDAPVSAEDLAAQAKWERNVRAGRSETVRYTTAHVLAPDGKPWEPGLLCKMNDTILRVTGTLILRAVSWSWSDRGPSVELELTRPEAYSQSEIPLRQSGGQW